MHVEQGIIDTQENKVNGQKSGFSNLIFLPLFDMLLKIGF